MTSVAVAPGSLGAPPSMLAPKMYHLQQGLNSTSPSPTSGKVKNIIVFRNAVRQDRKRYIAFDYFQISIAIKIFERFCGEQLLPNFFFVWNN